MTQTVEATAVAVPDNRPHQVAVANPVQYEQGTKLLAAIAEAAANPKVDVVKMKELMAMRREIMDEQRRVAFDAAFAAMQEELPEVVEKGEIKIVKDGKQVGKAQPYAKFEDILAAVRPILARHGFGVRFNIQDEQQFIRVTCILSHREGHREETSKLLPKDNSGSKNAVQAEGSSVSYGKRYTMNAILNIATRDEDDDGNAAVPPPASPLITAAQKEIILKALGGPGENVAKFNETYKLASLEKIKAKDFDRALAAAKRMMANNVTPVEGFFGDKDE